MVPKLWFSVAVALLGILPVTGLPETVGPSVERAFPDAPPSYIGHTADLERLARTRPEDAAELRRVLEAMVNRTDEEVERIVTVEFRHLDSVMNSNILLTSYPPQRDLMLTVNGHNYRVGLLPRPEYRVMPIPNFEQPIPDVEKSLVLEEDNRSREDLVKMVRAQLLEEARRSERLKTYQ
jgi:hypothetical protein